MSLRYLLVHAKNALLALELARKEATYLEYTHRTLFAMPIDAVWVQQLAAQPELAEKVEAFVSRFGRLQDHLGEKLIPRFAALLGESLKSLLDVLAYTEKLSGLQAPTALLAPENCETCWYTNICPAESCFCRRIWKLMVQRKCCSIWLAPLKPKQRALGSAKSS